jgi:hypothetical protein
VAVVIGEAEVVAVRVEMVEAAAVKEVGNHQKRGLW